MLSIWQRVRDRADRKQVYSRPEFWDAKAQKYKGFAVSLWDNEHLNRIYQQEHTALFDSVLPDVAGKRIADIGCGVGRISKHFADRGALVDGYDFSAPTIAIARELHAHDNIQWHVGSVFDFDEAERFDAIVVCGVLTVACADHGKVDEALKRIVAALKPGGDLLVLEPIHDSALARVLKMSVADFHAALRRQGLGILHTRELHFWPMRLLLSYAPLPRPVTTPLYRVGNAALQALGERRWGDYKFTHARLATDP